MLMTIHYHIVIVTSALKNTLIKDSEALIQWFKSNSMQATPSNYQTISSGQRTHEICNTFNISGITIECEDIVKLLEVDIDFKLNFNFYISKLCRKASRQLNVLKRLSALLNLQCNLVIYKTFILSAFNY